MQLSTTAARVNIRDEGQREEKDDNDKECRRVEEGRMKKGKIYGGEG